MVIYTINSKEALVDFVVSPTFMLGIWHGGDWLKEDLVPPNLWSGVTWKSLTCLAFAYVNKSYFPLYFMSKYIFYYVALMVVLSLLICWLYVGYKHGFMMDLSYVSHHDLVSK